MTISKKECRTCSVIRFLQTFVHHKRILELLIQFEIYKSPMNKLALVGFWIKSDTRTFAFLS